MQFRPTPLAGAFLVAMEPRADSRGMFARTFCAREFAAHDLAGVFVQSNISVNTKAGTVRGLHFQHAPHAEVKLVRCVKGAIFDVIVDLRENSPTRHRWFGAELSEENGLAMYVPKGFAHGYQVLRDGAAVFYLTSDYYTPQAESGLRYDDPALSILWPRAAENVSSKDSSWPLL